MQAANALPWLSTYPVPFAAGALVASMDDAVFDAAGGCVWGADAAGTIHRERVRGQPGAATTARRNIGRRCKSLLPCYGGGDGAVLLVADESSVNRQALIKVWGAELEFESPALALDLTHVLMTPLGINPRYILVNGLDPQAVPTFLIISPDMRVVARAWTTIPGGEFQDWTAQLMRNGAHARQVLLGMREVTPGAPWRSKQSVRAFDIPARWVEAVKSDELAEFAGTPRTATRVPCLTDEVTSTVLETTNYSGQLFSCGLGSNLYATKADRWPPRVIILRLTNNTLTPVASHVLPVVDFLGESELDLRLAWWEPGILLVTWKGGPVARQAVHVRRVAWTPGLQVFAPKRMRDAVRALLWLRERARDNDPALSSATESAAAAPAPMVGPPADIVNDEGLLTRIEPPLSLARVWGRLPMEMIEGVVACMWEDFTSHNVLFD